MKESVAAEAPVVPPETGASMKAGERLLQPGNGCALLCSLASETAAAISLEVFGLTVEQSINSDALVPPAYVKPLRAFTISWLPWEASESVTCNFLHLGNKLKAVT